MTELKKPELSKKKIIWGVVALIILIAIVSGGGNNQTKSSSTSSTQPSSTYTPKASQQQTTEKPAERVAQGTATTLGAGTFTGGTDVAVGLYDVTPGVGQSGNFYVKGADSYNEILGSDTSTNDVPKVRVKISKDDQIQISGLSAVTFTPVTAPFISNCANATLYAGTFVVGEDIGAGRYVVTPGAGQSGNFYVSGADSYNEILGSDTSMGDVPSLTVTLKNGDKIAISTLSEVNFATK